MSGTYQFCICDEEWCFCTATVFIDDEVMTYPPPEKPCKECAEGRHVRTPGGDR